MAETACPIAHDRDDRRSAAIAEAEAHPEPGFAPVRAFDLDHYDVPAEALPRLIAGGARHVTGKQLVRALIASGLRIPARDR